jgi:hypothetical protein
MQRRLRQILESDAAFLFGALCLSLFSVAAFTMVVIYGR